MGAETGRVHPGQSTLVASGPVAGHRGLEGAAGPCHRWASREVRSRPGARTALTPSGHLGHHIQSAALPLELPAVS